MNKHIKKKQKVQVIKKKLIWKETKRSLCGFCLTFFARTWQGKWAQSATCRCIGKVETGGFSTRFFHNALFRKSRDSAPFTTKENKHTYKQLKNMDIYVYLAYNKLSKR